MACLDYAIEVQPDTADVVALYSIYPCYDGTVQYQVPIAYLMPLTCALDALRNAIGCQSGESG